MHTHVTHVSISSTSEMTHMMLFLGVINTTLADSGSFLLAHACTKNFSTCEIY